MKLFPGATNLLDKEDEVVPGWHIVNDSVSPVWIREIGFTSAKRTLPFFKRRMAGRCVPIYSPILTNCPESLQSQEDQPVKFPLRLGTWEAMTLAAPDTSVVEIAKRFNLHYIYALTSNHHSFIADMGDLNDFLK